ncbi:unnamed protein product [Rotaria sp. Silwood2]|nr:unnamed protein product [Rotaria sp. Silwood2]CAF2944102.1 unnamed protein product [Rotaria sp. Silwood2]CAF3330059.1 unnamed protein product [Rotaria sp. Silwood2]CAF4018816.1 unnamed protein product [Rotaria sp. Silwood2]CAF4020431.1 unnamed protein product [Rotaria sp. Silwood2]
MATIVDNSSTEINVVIIGETGTGKSTLINYLTNLFYDGSLTNLKIAIPTRYLKSNMSSIMSEHHENFLDDITRCKTSQCTKYQFKIQQVYFNFFDTPGINDTGGYLVDNENLNKIFECIQSFEYLTALVLVLNGTQARLTINIKNVLERFHDRVPDIFYSNIILILTNCTSHTVNFESIKFLNHPPMFYMQNSAFSSDPQTWSEQTLEILRHDWNISIRTMNDFIKTLVLLTPISTKSLLDINNDRNIIRSVLHESRLIIMELQQIEDELFALEQASNIYSENIEKYTIENDTQPQTILVNEITTTPYHNTICLQCNIVCHERCSLNEATKVGEHVFRHCKAMDNGRCTVCPGRCSCEMHYHDRRLIKSVPRTLKLAISSLSNKYTEAEENKAACEIKCKTVQETKRLIEQLLQEQCNKVHDACIRVQSNCEGFNIAEELYTFVSLLKNDLNKLRSPTVIHKAKKFIEKLEILANDSTLMVSRRSHPNATKKKTRTSKKRNQSQVTSTIQSDDLMIIDQPYTSTLVTQIDDNPTEVLLFEDNLFNRIQSSQQPTSNFSSSRKYSRYTTEQLIDLTRQSMEKNILVAKELNRRCETASIGYLSATQLLTLCEYYASCRLLRPDELTRLYSQLQLEMQQSNNSDLSENFPAPVDKLLYLTAIKLCLENADTYQ